MTKDTGQRAGALRGTLLVLPTALLGLATTPFPAASQSREGMAEVHSLLQQGRDLLAVEALRRLAAVKPDGTADESALSALQQYGPRLNGLVVPRPVPQGPPTNARDSAAVRHAERRDAIETIVAMARDRRIVILNEAHDDPEHRAFALAVAKALRPLGFSFLAIEAFSNDEDPSRSSVAGLAERGYPIRATGGYLGDPVFGDFVRQSLALGYRPIAYEQTLAQTQRESGDTVGGREEAQAENLAKAMAGSPGSRTMVFVGYHHAAKSTMNDGDGPQLWMAARLWKLTGSEPLSIDQTGLGSTSDDRAARMLRDRARRGLARSAVLFSAGQPLVLGEWRGNVDLQVVHPATTTVSGRPTWLRMLARHPQAPDPGLFPAHGRTLVQAYLADEGTDAVPIDEVVLSRNAPSTFMLPDAPVRFVARETVP